MQFSVWLAANVAASTPVSRHCVPASLWSLNLLHSSDEYWYCRNCKFLFHCNVCRERITSEHASDIEHDCKVWSHWCVCRRHIVHARTLSHHAQVSIRALRHLKGYCTDGYSCNATIMLEVVVMAAYDSKEALLVHTTHFMSSDLNLNELNCTVNCPLDQFNSFHFISF